MALNRFFFSVTVTFSIGCAECFNKLEIYWSKLPFVQLFNGS